MIKPVELARFFHGLNICGFLNYTDKTLVPGGARAEEAWIVVGDVVADRTLADFFLGLADCIRERQCLLWVHAQQIKRQTLRGFLADTGQPSKFIDQSCNGRREIRHARSLLQSGPISASVLPDRTTKSLSVCVRWRLQYLLPRF